MINFNRIETDIFIGSGPQTSVDVNRLTQMKINAVVSLQSDSDFKTHKIDWDKLYSNYLHNKIIVHRFPIIDFDETDLGNRLAQPVKALNKLLINNHRVYVHCNAGICRAPATVLGYLCHYRGMTIDHGIEYIRKNRPQANPYVGAVKKVLSELKASTSD